MPFKPCEAQSSGLLQEVLFSSVDIAALGHPEADVHSGAHRLVGHDTVCAGLGVQGIVDELGFLVGDGLLAVDFVREIGQKILEDLAGDVDT